MEEGAPKRKDKDLPGKGALVLLVAVSLMLQICCSPYPRSCIPAARQTEIILDPISGQQTDARPASMCLQVR